MGFGDWDLINYLMSKPARLILADGTIFSGVSFGYEKEGYGEVVFNTSMSGYQEILTDPSYAGQIVVMTYPEIGNYGVNPVDVESHKLFLSGFVVKEASPVVSNFRATMSLGDYLKENKIPAIEGIDTRALVRHIRDKGAMQALIVVGAARDLSQLKRKAKALPSIEGQDLASTVTCKESYEWSEGVTRIIYKKQEAGVRKQDTAVNGRRTIRLRRGFVGQADDERRSMIDSQRAAHHTASGQASGERRFYVIAYDFGIKQNILRMLVDHGCRVKVVPADYPAERILQENPDGVFLSNGPGDPAPLNYAIENTKKLLGKKPLFGICLGHQIMGIALGGKSFKLKFGHHGGNQPVMDLSTRKVEITAQNHGFAVDSKTLPDDVEVTHINLNDQTVEGIAHKSIPAFSVQYHPEASPGPHDSHYLFERFVGLMNGGKGV